MNAECLTCCKLLGLVFYIRRSRAIGFRGRCQGANDHQREGGRSTVALVQTDGKMLIRPPTPVRPQKQPNLRWPYFRTTSIDTIGRSSPVSIVAPWITQRQLSFVTGRMHELERLSVTGQMSTGESVQG